MYVTKRSTSTLVQLFLLCSPVIESTRSSQAQTVFEDLKQPAFTFGSTWHSLGPFRIGTREAVWGVDPLEVVGGFGSLQYDINSGFRSPLAPNATVRWSEHTFGVEHHENYATIQFDVSHSEIDWEFQQQVYGWAALQYQTWTRGELHNNVPEARNVWLSPLGILELCVNGQCYFGGDFFSFDRAAILVNLQPGSNILDVRLIRDVRAMGGKNPPSIEAEIRVRLAGEQPEINYDQVVAPDVVAGRLTGRHFSFPISNPLKDWIVVYECLETSNEEWSLISKSLRIAPGQTRPVMFNVSHRWSPTSVIAGTVCYSVESVSESSQSHHLRFAVSPKHRTISEASKFTFMHPGGVVSYAILKPPTKKVEREVPLLVLLHGAGLEADSYQVRHSLDQMPHLEAFALFPTGMSQWSGDDWHLWGTLDTLSAIEAVHEWIMQMQWNDTCPTTKRVVVSGHSNGGQGTWFFATHFPDKIVAAAPASAYTSIENYVPYSMWSETDPLKSGIVHAARGNYRHELVVENLAYIPILQQHGSADDNVPPYHARLMSSLRAEADMGSEYVELEGKPHWWDGAITTATLQDFYTVNLESSANLTCPKGNFSIVIPGTGEVDSKFGIVVDQLQSPDRFGRIDVVTGTNGRTGHWHLMTTNIHRLHFDFGKVDCPQLMHVKFDSGPNFTVRGGTNFQKTYIQTTDGNWTCSNETWTGLNQRYGKQRGALDAILRSDGPFQIVSCSIKDYELAVQVSRNFLQYYGADAMIRDCKDYEDARRESGNVILIVSGPELPLSQLNEYPIIITQGIVYLRSLHANYVHSIPGQPGTGATFLRPLKDQRLELVVWGIDDVGLGQAMRLVPTLTGAGQPDFVVLGPKAKFQGSRGALAMGFFDYAWNISRASYVP